MVTRGDIGDILNCLPLNNEGHTDIKLCNQHYRMLHRQLRPENYQWKCGICSSTIKGFNYRTCPEPELLQEHLLQNTDFLGTLAANTKVCMACYRYSLIVLAIVKENPKINDDDLQSLVGDIQKSVPVQPLLNITVHSELVEVALKLTTIHVAQ